MLSACSEPPGQYKLGLHDAYERLVKGDFNDFKTNAIAAFSSTSQITGRTSAPSPGL